MTNVILPSDSSRKKSFSEFRVKLASAFKPERNYNILVFASLIVWFIAVQVLYTLIDGPGISTQNRASEFVIKMVSYGTSYLLLWACWSLIKFTRNLGDTSLFVALIRAYKDNPTLPLTWTIRAALAMISYVLLMTNFMSVKTLIPEIMPFYLDEAAYKIDRILFLGRDPWTLFSWMYDFPSIIVGIDRIYTAWIGLIVGIWIYCFTSRSMPSNHRYQYIISSILLWLIAGNIMAILLSSAGPIYFDYFTGSNVYQPLKLSLAAIHETHSLGAYDYSEKLLMMYENKETRFAGISALPSMHCASSFMILLLFWKNKILRTLLIAFNIIIFIGSIVLAWHYAIDGLIGYFIALLCWKASHYILSFSQTA